MSKVYKICFLLLAFGLRAKADHITGGEIFYTYSPTSVTGYYNYNVTFKLFMRCFSNRQFNNPTIVSIFDKTSNQRISDINVPLQSSETISITNSDPCITNPPQVCYVVGYYSFTVALPASANGYVLSSQVNYRIAGINNLQPGYSNIGATYTAEIPGTSEEPTGAKNNSAKFVGSDLVVVCSNNRFSYSFAATDDDNDGLRYSFCSAYRSGSGGNMVVPPPNPPYIYLPYGNSFSGDQPLGLKVQIDSKTGLITGTAPEDGIYVVTVCVEEIRNGIVIARQRKDLQINIAPCNIAAAQLPPEYMLCGDTKKLDLVNLSLSPLIHTSLWRISTRANATLFTSSDPTPSYTFADTGLYYVSLIINKNEACTDSTTSLVRVYPGFVPDFSFKGICFTKPTVFNDKTTTVYGQVTNWYWEFGNTDYAIEQSPTYTYATMGTWNAQLTVENSVGCRDKVLKQVGIILAPPLNFAFKDTLICIGDTVTLKAFGSGNFTWKPTVNTINADSPEITVKPSATTEYNVLLNDNGCINNDSVLVRVTDHVDLRPMNDTIICQGDTVRLRVASDAFKYSWSPVNQLIDASAREPLAVTNASTKYNVAASIGGCSAQGQITITTVPYPYTYAGKDTAICFDSKARLSGITDGQSIRWSPPMTLDNPTIANPLASPTATTSYVLSARNSRGCPKSGSDTIVVTVLPAIEAFAGHDTAVIVEQPLQLKASGGTRYVWYPDIGLSDPNVPNPVAQYNEPFEALLYKVTISNIAGCFDSAFVTVKVFNTRPSIFVPTAFTPNADGKNDVIRPIAVGMKQIENFYIYNRWGQLVFQSNINGKGWDGTHGGVPQPTGTYVWFVKATDYNGIPYFQKGTVTLIK